MMSPTLAPSPWWNPDIHRARRPRLLARARIARAVRARFEALDFVEVETTALQRSPGAEAHLHAFATEAIDEAGGRTALYLHTSPEFACKKLLAAGEPRIFSLGRVWRNRERGLLHLPEFTMLEWYRTGAPYSALVEDVHALLVLAADEGEASSFSFRGRVCDPRRAPERVTVAEVFRDFVGFDLFSTLDAEGEGDAASMGRLLTAQGVRVAADDTWADMFSRAMVECVEPRLGVGAPTILCEYPRSVAALARPVETDPRLAERFELYACGVELANAFGELTDPVDQRRRFDAEMDEKARVYGERFPIDEDLLAALTIMPAASGAALGFDRLVMLAAGAQRVDQVVWTPMTEGR